MKTQRFIIGKAVALLAVVMVTLIGCAPEDDTDIPTDARDKYLGTWECAEDLQGGSPATFNVQITKNTTDTTRINIASFNNLGTVSAVVNGNNITLPAQEIITNYNIVSGSGTYTSGAGISMQYTIDANGNTEVYTATFTKQ